MMESIDRLFIYANDKYNYNITGLKTLKYPKNSSIMQKNTKFAA